MIRRTANSVKWKRIPLSVFVLIVFYTIVVMLFCAGTSPVIDYPTTDSSVFMVMGSGMAKGKTAYKLLFDHKGWYLYLFNMIGSFFSTKGFYGVFVVECFFACINGLILYKISELINTNNRFLHLIFVALNNIVIYNYFTYQGGNLSEFYALAFLYISAYLELRSFRLDTNGHSSGYSLIHGICVGIVFCLRANLIAAWVGIAVVIIIRLISLSNYKSLFLNIVFGLLGIIIALFPPFLYALFTHSIEDMIEASLLFNMAYSGSGSIVQKIIGTYSNPVGICMLIICAISLLIVWQSKTIIWERIMFTISLTMSLIMISLSGRYYGHYFMALIPFATPLPYYIVKKIDGIGINKKWILIGCIILTIAFNMRFTIKIIGNSNSSLYMQCVHDISEQFGSNVQGQRVFVGNNNAIIYECMGVTPSDRFFYIPSIDYELFPDAVDAQIESIMSGANDIIVLGYYDYSNNIVFQDGIQNDKVLKYIQNNYNLVYEKNSFRVWEKNDNNEV